MIHSEIKADIKSRINKLGIKGAYLDIVLANAKTIKQQLKITKTKHEIAYLIQLSHSFSVSGIKRAGMMKDFTSLFYSDNVIHDHIYDESIDAILKLLKTER